MLTPQEKAVLHVLQRDEAELTSPPGKFALGNTVQLGADGGAIVQRGPQAPDQTHELGFRFNLHPDTTPGSYPWPLMLSVRGL